jgi:trans-2-enoyl-CoA reductase
MVTSEARANMAALLALLRHNRHQIRDRIVDPVTGREVKGKTVIVVSRDWCKYCQTLIRDEMPKAKAKGYTVIVDKKTEAAGYPLTRIWDGKQWEQRDGFFKWVKP